MNEYSGVHGDFHWEWRGQMLHVFSAKRRIGELRTFENVVAQNSEQAQWAAQARIDRNLDALYGIEAQRAAAFDDTDNTAEPKP